MITSSIDRLQHDIAVTQAAMAEASRIVLNGFELRTEAKIVHFPDRYSDARGAVMWARVMKLIAERESGLQLAA